MRGLHVTTMMLLQVLNIFFGGAEVTSFFGDHYCVVAGRSMRGGRIIVTSTQYSYGI